MTGRRKGAGPGGNRPSIYEKVQATMPKKARKPPGRKRHRAIVEDDGLPMGRGVDAAIYQAMAISAQSRAESAALGCRVMPTLPAKDVRDPRWPSKVRRVHAAEVAELGYQPPAPRPSKPPAPVPVGNPEVAGREARMARAASDRRLGKEIRAYARLDAINEAWERRGRK